MLCVLILWWGEGGFALFPSTNADLSCKQKLSQRITSKQIEEMSHPACLLLAWCFFLSLCVYMVCVCSYMHVLCGDKQKLKTVYLDWWPNWLETSGVDSIKCRQQPWCKNTDSSVEDRSQMCCCPLMDNYICTAGSVIEANLQSKILESVGTQKYLKENCATRVTGWERTRMNLNLKINSLSLNVRSNKVSRHFWKCIKF